jgi:glycosyltransferase involved in cell wall biosynthesis
MNVGGPALQVTALTRGLGPPRFESRLLVGSVETGEADYLELRAPDLPFVKVHGLGRAPSPVDDVAALRQIVREIRAFRPHIVHTHTAKAGVLGRMAAQACRVPATVHTFHGHLLHGYFSPRVRRAVVQTERTLARRTTRLVAVGAQVRDDLIAAGIGTVAQFTVVPPGVELPRPVPAEGARRLLGLPVGPPVVSFVARLTEVKRPDRFADVALELARRIPDVAFAVCGEGKLLGDLRHHLAPLGDQVHFLGWRPDVENVYAASDVVVLTSDNEGMPVSLIEAATVGTPAVTTDVGSAREVVIDGRTGYVTSRAVADIAGAVERLLGDPATRESMGRAAVEHARAHFGADRLVGDTARLYEGLAERLRLAP